MLADVTRIGEWSHECQGAEWLDGAATAAPVSEADLRRLGEAARPGS